MNVGGRIEAFLTVPTGASISVTNNGGGPTTVTLTAGSYTPTSLCAHLQTVLTAQRAPSAGAWAVSVSTGVAGTGLVTIAMSAGTFSITWTSTTLRDALGFSATITSVTSATATTQAKGLWFPDCPLVMAHDPQRAPEVTDTMGTRGPTGRVIGYSSNLFYRHRALMYSHVQQGRVYEGAALTPGCSWQQWLRDTQWGRGHAWFSPCSAFQIYWDNAGTEQIVGVDLNSGSGPSSGWAFDPPLPDMDHVSLAAAPWVGVMQLSLGAVVSQG